MTNPSATDVRAARGAGGDSRLVPSIEQLAIALDASPTGMIVIDSSGVIARVNGHAERIFGYTRAEMIGRPVEQLVPARLCDRHPSYGLRKDGTEVPIEIGLNPLTTIEGTFVLSAIVDITERRRAEQEKEALVDQLRTLNAELEARVARRTAELTATLEERDVLLQEIHHRVKNNLQVISSMINMQLRSLDGLERDALKQCQMRVQAIALIHEKLSQSRDYARVPFAQYVRSLAGTVFHASGVAHGAVSLELAVEDVSLAVDKAIPCGLLLNELIANAMKHAFPDDRRGTLRVELSTTPDHTVRLAVRDDGAGLPEHFDIRTSRSLGLHLVHTLAKQLNAELVVRRERGSSFELTFES